MNAYLAHPAEKPHQPKICNESLYKPLLPKKLAPRLGTKLASKPAPVQSRRRASLDAGMANVSVQR